MVFFDEQGNVFDVNMQELQNEVQQQHNHSLIGEKFVSDESLMQWEKSLQDFIEKPYRLE